MSQKSQLPYHHRPEPDEPKDPPRHRRKRGHKPWTIECQYRVALLPNEKADAWYPYSKKETDVAAFEALKALHKKEQTRAEHLRWRFRLKHDDGRVITPEELHEKPVR